MGRSQPGETTKSIQTLGDIDIRGVTPFMTNFWVSVSQLLLAAMLIT